MNRSRLYVVLFCSALCFALLFPGAAFAWGPGVHMITGNWILQNLATLPPVVAGALMLFPGQYLHGCLSADIFLGKGSEVRKGHSHNWESGFALLSRAADRPDRLAYAYGYLSHLAADTLAHNVFVPGLYHLLPGSGRFAHVLLEAQVDYSLAWDSKDAVGVFHEKNSRPAARMLRSTMGQGALPFWLKKQIFQGSIVLGGSLAWRRSLGMVSGLMPSRNLHGLVDRMLVLSARAVADVLHKGEASEITGLDPIGAKALAHAASRRKRAVRLARRGEAQALQGAALRLRVKEPEVFSRIPRICPFEPQKGEKSAGGSVLQQPRKQSV